MVENARLKTRTRREAPQLADALPPPYIANAHATEGIYNRKGKVKAMAPRARSKSAEEIPYEAKVYLNNQVLIPANLVRALGLQEARGARITLEYGEKELTIDVRLLRTRHTDSRQFTIPKSVREKYGILPGTTVKVKKIEAVR